MTARESIEAKAARLLVTACLTVTRVDSDGGFVTATCAGQDGNVYELGYDPRRPGGWWCSCAAAEHGHRCAHVLALQTVTIRRRPPAPAQPDPRGRLDPAA